MIVSWTRTNTEFFFATSVITKKKITDDLLNTSATFASVLQIRDFQLVGQWAEGLKGISSPQVVQERCIFLLSRSTKNGEN